MMAPESISQTALVAALLAGENSMKRSYQARRFLTDEQRLSAAFVAAIEAMCAVLATKSDAIEIAEWEGLTIIQSLGHALAREAA